MTNLPTINFFERFSDSGVQIACFHFQKSDLKIDIINDLQNKNEGIFGVFCVEGNLDIKLNEQVINVKSGNMCSFFTGNFFHIEDCSNDFSGYVLFVSSYYITRIDSQISVTFFLHSFYNPILELSSSDIEILSSLLQMAEIRLNQSTRLFFKEINYHMLMILLYELCSMYDRNTDIINPSQIREKVILKDFLQLVNANCHKEHNLGFYAGKLSITSKHLSLCIKKLSGHTGAEWINFIMLIKIKRMLLNSPMTIQQVSDYFNFPDNSIFGKYFKKQVGMTPRAFRLQG